ncbi:MAG: cofactor assembly of complex C subunit B [Cyanobacteria bacterium P01_B01_bin.77]
MESAVSQSTFFLTLLLGVGLFFFIKASTKERTQIAEFTTEQSSEALHQTLLDYFQNRAYTLLVETEPTAEAKSSVDDGWVRLTGLVRPSLFLAIFLSCLAAVALLCFALVLATLFSSYGAIFFALVLLSPLTAIVYWKRAKREEQIAFRIHEEEEACILSVRAHRDEIIQLKANAPFKSR